MIVERRIEVNVFLDYFEFKGVFISYMFWNRFCFVMFLMFFDDFLVFDYVLVGVKMKVWYVDK